VSYSPMVAALRLAIAAIVSALTCRAGLLTIASVNPYGPCSPPETVTGTTSATVTLCTGIFGGTASANSSFDIGSPSLSNLSIFDSAGAGVVSTSSASFGFPLVVTGSSGLGFMALNFVYSFTGQNDPMASAGSTFTESLNGTALTSPKICSSGFGGPFSCSGTLALGFNFIYGTPFDLSVTLAGVSGGGIGGYVPITSITGGGPFNYSVDFSGTTLVPNPNGMLNLVPEPSSLAMFLLASAFAIAALCPRARCEAGRPPFGRI
jgi:hypothetical protein